MLSVTATLALIFVVLSIIRNSYNNIIVIKLITEIWIVATPLKMYQIGHEAGAVRQSDRFSTKLQVS